MVLPPSDSAPNIATSSSYSKQTDSLLSADSGDLVRKVLALIERNLREIVLVVVFVGAIFYVVSSIAKGRIREQEILTSKLKQVRGQLAAIIAPVEKEKSVDEVQGNKEEKKEDKEKLGVSPQGDEAILEGAKKAFDAAVTSLSDEANLGVELAPLYRSIALMRSGQSAEALALMKVESANNQQSTNPIIAELKALLIARIKGDRESLKNLALTGTYAAAGAIHTLKLLANTPAERTEAEELIKKVVERIPAVRDQLVNLE
jgi:hypothetical protein